MTRRNLMAILRGGYCTRWHANPDMAHIRETLAEHHARVAQIILALHPDPTLDLIDAALHHDAGEPTLGDLPQPFKASHPELAAAHAAAEDVALERIGCRFDLSGDDLKWLKFADRLAAYAHAAQVAPALLRRDDWVNAGIGLRILGSALLGDRGAAEVLRQVERRV